MLRRSGARRLGVTKAAAAVQTHLLIGVSARRALNRCLTVTKCVAGAGASRLLKGTLRVFAISDLHTHHRENLNWVRQLSTTEHQHDVLIVAGDISDDLEDLRVTLLALRQRFAVVFFCPGNHELWVSGRQRHHREGFSEVPVAAAGAQEPQPKGKQAGPNGDCGGQPCKPVPVRQPHQTVVHDSLEKLAVVMALCQELDVHVMPARLGRLRIVPLLAWHHKSFDKEPDIPGIPRASPFTISDYARCMWPARMVTELEAMRRFGSYSVRQHECQIQDQQQQHQQQQQDGHVMGYCSTSAPDPATADDSTAFPKAKGKNSGGSCGGTDFGADWGDGGHGSDAVAAWFDALNEPPYGWGCVYSHNTSSRTAGSSRVVDSVDRSGIREETNFGNTAGPAASAPLVCHQLDHLPEMLEGENTSINTSNRSRPSTSTTINSSSSSSSSTPTTASTCSSRRSGTATSNGSRGQNDPNGRPSDTECSIQALQQGLLQQQQQQQQYAQIPLRVAGVDEGVAAEEVQDEEDVISFSHFLPFQELLPEKRYLTFPNLAKAVGSSYLAERVRRLRPQMHVFGHTHFAWDEVRDGIRYVQAPLAYPSERRFRLRSLVMTGAGGPQEKDRNGTTAGGGASIAATEAENSRAGTTSAEPTSRTLTSPPPPTHISEPEQGLQARGTQLRPGSSECKSKFSEAREEPTWQREARAGLQEQESLTAPWPSSLDPGDGRWLPLCIYRAQYTVRVLPRTDTDDGGCGVASEAAEAALDLASALAQPPHLQPIAKLLLRPAARASTRGGVMAAGLGAAGDELERVPEVEVLEWQSQWCPEQAAMWSSYYKRHARRPHELQLAPWVAERYSRRFRRSSATGSAASTSASSPLTSSEDACPEGKAGDGMDTDTPASGESDPEETGLK